MIRKMQLKNRFNNNQEVLIEYLKDRITRGKLFFKSRHIALDLGMTPKAVGTNLKVIADQYDGFKIEKWSYSKSTTWYVMLNNG